MFYISVGEKELPMSVEAKAWIVAADMGYGHLRAVYPLKHLAEENIITAGVDDGASEKEKKLWLRVMRTYAAFSRASSVPLVGKPLFNMLDRIQRIPRNTPGRDLTGPNFQLDLLEGLIARGLCSGMLERIRSNHRPLLTSFYAPAVAANLARYNPLFCIICDAEIHRVWVARSPRESRIQYFAPCERAVQRLRAYGVPPEKIFLTGFPLPGELIGGRDCSILKNNLAKRLHRLDPQNKFSMLPAPSQEHSSPISHRPLTITYAVGGAGAQKEIGKHITQSLSKQLREGTVKLNLVAGLNARVRDYFSDVKKTFAPDSAHIEIIYEPTFEKYFSSFNTILHDTDILWTKPSELAFYSALGLPIIMAPPLGSQEEYNRHWLLEIGAGIDQQNPLQTADWLMEMVGSGALARAAWAGYSGVRKLGTHAIAEILTTGEFSEVESPVAVS